MARAASCLSEQLFDDRIALFVGPTGLSADEKVAYERLQFVYQKGIAYGYQMGLRPQT